MPKSCWIVKLSLWSKVLWFRIRSITRQYRSWSCSTSIYIVGINLNITILCYGRIPCFPSSLLENAPCLADSLKKHSRICHLPPFNFVSLRRTSAATTVNASFHFIPFQLDTWKAWKHQAKFWCRYCNGWRKQVFNLQLECIAVSPPLHKIAVGLNMLLSYKKELVCQIIPQARLSCSFVLSILNRVLYAHFIPWFPTLLGPQKWISHCWFHDILQNPWREIPGIKIQQKSWMILSFLPPHCLMEPKYEESTISEVHRTEDRSLVVVELFTRRSDSLYTGRLNCFQIHGWMKLFSSDLQSWSRSIEGVLRNQPKTAWF